MGISFDLAVQSSAPSKPRPSCMLEENPRKDRWSKASLEHFQHPTSSLPINEKDFD